MPHRLFVNITRAVRLQLRGDEKQLPKLGVSFDGKVDERARLGNVTQLALEHDRLHPDLSEGSAGRPGQQGRENEGNCKTMQP